MVADQGMSHVRMMQKLQLPGSTATWGPPRRSLKMRFAVKEEEPYSTEIEFFHSLGSCEVWLLDDPARLPKFAVCAPRPGAADPSLSTSSRPTASAAPPPSARGTSALPTPSSTKRENKIGLKNRKNRRFCFSVCKNSCW